MITKKILPLFLCFFISIACISNVSAQNNGVSKKEIKEYKSLIENCYDKNGNPLEVSKKDAERIKNIYANMTKKQKSKLAKRNLPSPATKPLGVAKGIAKTNSLLPSDAIYFINEKVVSSEEAMKTISDNRFRMVRKKTDEGYEFYITLL